METPTLLEATRDVAKTIFTPSNANPASTTITTATSTVTMLAKDNSFGPQLGSKFDFTLLFEHSIFTAVPAGLLIAACPFYVYYQRNDKIQVKRGKLFWIKMATAFALFVVQITQLALWAKTPDTLENHWAIGTSAISCFAAICIALMLNTEHRRAIQPSTILSIYFATSVVFDVVKARSFFLQKSPITIAAVQVVIASVKAGLLILEEMPKASLLKDNNSRRTLGREAVSGFWTRSLGIWMYETFSMGFYNVLSIDDLGELSPDFSTALLAQRFEVTWGEAQDYPKRFRLALATFKVCRRPLLLAAIPRTFMSVCSLAQPFLIHYAISIIRQEDLSHATKMGLILATILVYGGLALFGSIYTSSIDRTSTIVRGVLTGKICSKAFYLKNKEAAKGASMTHSTTDIDIIIQGLLFIHEIWISFIELGFIMYFLWIFIRYSCFFILIPTFVSVFWTMIFGPLVGAAQQVWNEKIETRVSETTQILAQAKQVKTLGFQATLSDYIQRLRVTELQFQRQYRTLNSVIVVMGMSSASLTPVLIIAGALFVTQILVPLDANRVFATLAIVQLSTTPLRYTVEAYSRLNAVFTSFDRIQEFILLQEQADERSHTRPTRQTSPAGLEINMADEAFVNRPIDFQGVSLGHEANSTPILHSVDIAIPQGYLAIARGPNGSGKTTLLKNLIGEGKVYSGHPYVAQGPIAYCEQTAWLRNVSIRENILGYLPFNAQWYHTVLKHCCLVEDLRQMPSGDRTLAGNAGSKLSGGQRQRISLARALYLRSTVLVLDDVFSALDDYTARRVFAKLFNHDGLLRQLGTTVVLATQKIELFPAADIQLEFNGKGNVLMKNGEQCQINDYARGTSEDKETPDNIQMTAAEKTLDAISEKNSIYHKSDLGVYQFFFNAGSIKLLILFILATAFTTVGERMPGIFMRYWLNNFPGSKTLFGAYAALSTSSIFGYLGMAAIFYHNLVPKYGQNMHKMLVDSMLGATIPYLTSTDHGVLINRISQHMTHITQQFARDFFKLPYAFLNIVVDVAIIASASYYTIILVPIISVVLYLVQLVYLRTSRQLRILDIDAKTPMYSLLAEAGSGVGHMRSFGWEEAYLQRTYQVLDYSQKPFYSMACVQRWLKFVMDCINACIALGLMCLAIFGGHFTSETGLGLAFVTLMGLAECIKFFMDQWVAIETSLGSIAGIRSFVKEAPVEKDADDKEADDKAPPLPESWPQTGLIEFKDVTAFYAIGEKTTAALRDISVIITDKEKAAIKGRTGSGKSSVFLTLLNCLSYEGSIKIDGYELRDIPRDRLRTSIALCPQENLKLPGTIRQNLMPWLLNDPSKGRLHDFGVAEIIKHLDLLDAIIAAGGLDAPMDDLELSAGQDQLFSIARTMMTKIHRSSKIILMDEVTSNLDASKEDMILNAINVAFDECTVLTIAHRQRTIDEAEKVYKMKYGNMKNEDDEDSTSDDTSETARSTTGSGNDSDGDDGGAGGGSSQCSPDTTQASKAEEQQQSSAAAEPEPARPEASEKSPDTYTQESEHSSSLSPEHSPPEPRPQKHDPKQYVEVAQEFIQYAQDTTNAVELFRQNHAAEYDQLPEIRPSMPERAPEENTAPYAMLITDTSHPFDPVRGPMIRREHIDLPFFQSLDSRASETRSHNKRNVPPGPVPRPKELLHHEKSVLDRVLDNLERFEEDPDAITPQNRINWARYSVAEVAEIRKLRTAEKQEIYERYVKK